MTDELFGKLMRGEIHVIPVSDYPMRSAEELVDSCKPNMNREELLCLVNQARCDAFYEAFKMIKNETAPKLLSMAKDAASKCKIVDCEPTTA